MPLKISIYNETPQRYVEQQLRDRLAPIVQRFHDRVGPLEVVLRDENGPRGGEDDKLCTIEIQLVPRGHLFVRAKHKDLAGAVAKAVQRAETVIAKAVDRGRCGQQIRHTQARQDDLAVG